MLQYHSLRLFTLMEIVLLASGKRGAGRGAGRLEPRPAADSCGVSAEPAFECEGAGVCGLGGGVVCEESAVAAAVKSWGLLGKKPNTVDGPL